MDYVLLTREVLDLGKINDQVAHESCGAISYFVGTTRDNFESKKVLSLEYEAYEPMAIKEIRGICEELRSRWPDIVNIAIYHRLGLVQVREASVIIAISSPHRQTALDATAQAIEDLKRRVPIWKKEKYSDEEEIWKENPECPKKAKKSEKALDFSKCPISLTQKSVSDDQIQISAPETEIERRIQSFIKQKREQIDLSNVLDFVGVSNSSEALENKMSCARTDSVVIKQEQSKGHLRVRRVRNDANSAPQTRPNYLKALDKHMSEDIKFKPNQNTLKLNVLSNERIENVESFLKLPYSATQSIHERLKAIENRILFLETVSPEYKHFLCHPKEIAMESKDFNVKGKRIHSQMTKRSFTIKQLDDIINEYEQET